MRVDLQVSRNNTDDLTGNRRRKGRFDSGVAARVLTRSLILFVAGDSRLYTLSGCGRLYNLGIADENGGEVLPDIDCIANFGFPFPHYSRKGRLNRINRLIGFDFTKIVVERDLITG